MSGRCAAGFAGVTRTEKATGSSSQRGRSAARYEPAKTELGGAADDRRGFRPRRSGLLQGRRMQPFGATPMFWERLSLELMPAWAAARVRSPNTDAVPNTVPGLVASLFNCSSWKAAQSEMEVLRMDASGPVAVQVRSTVKSVNGSLGKLGQTGVV